MKTNQTITKAKAEAVVAFHAKCHIAGIQNGGIPNLVFNMFIQRKKIPTPDQIKGYVASFAKYGIEIAKQYDFDMYKMAKIRASVN